MNIKKSNLSTLEKFEMYVSKYSIRAFLAIVLLSITLSFFNLDIKITTANDDALYIESGYNFSKDFFGYFHIANAPLYPILLSPIIKIFGINLIAIKLFSLLFCIISMFITYYTFKDRIPRNALLLALLIFYCSYYYIFYSVQAYSEGLFLLVQSLFIWIIFRLIDSNKLKISNLFLFGFISLVLTITRSIAIGLIVVPIVYFLISKRYKLSLLCIGSFGVMRMIYEIFKSLLWGEKSQFTNQSQIILQKHPYDASQGMEDLAGFISRLFDNANIYLSTKMLENLGLRKPDSIILEPLTFFCVLILVISFIIIWKSKNPFLLVTSIYAITFMGLTFVALQAFWGQHRFIMVIMPYILIYFISSLYYLFNKEGLRGYQFFYFILVIPMLVGPVKLSAKNGIKNLPVLKKNLNGNNYAGYSPDWINYLKMSKWCADSLPNANIACRKAPMSFVYSGGKSFIPIYNVPFQDADSLMNNLKSSKVEYIIDARLRLNPKVNNGEYVNTITRMLYIIYQKYNDAFITVHEIGAESGEGSTLYKINYNSYEQSSRK